jgi:hypothetical protein
LGGKKQGNTRQGNYLWGCKKQKLRSILRIGFLNINGFSHRNNKHEDDFLHNRITTFDFDSFGMAETDTNWHTVPEDDKVYSQTK